MAAKGKTIAPTAPEFWCKICKLPFKTDGAFKIHKVNSDRHICCDVCGADFNSEEGKKRHRAANHAEEQDLTCKFCGLNYPRVGSLINHYEESQCKNVSKEVFKQAIRDTMGHQQAVRKAHNFKDIHRSGDFSGQTNEPLPPFRQASSSPQIPVNAGGRESETRAVSGVQYSGTHTAGMDGGWSNAAARDFDATATGYGTSPLINIVPDTPIGEDEDLISLDTQSMILNSSWSIPASDALRSNPMFNKSRDFPALGKANEGSSTAKSVYQNDPTTSQTSNPASVNRGPPHTWGQSSITGSNVSQGPVNQANRVLPHLRGNIYTANSAANAAGSPHTQAAPNKIDNQYGSSLTRAGGNDTYAYASDAPDLATIPGVGVGTNEKIRPLGQYVAPRSSAKNGPTQSPWGSQNLFPDAPPVVAPPVDILSSLNIGTPAPPIKVYKKFDPADPAFKASKYYVDVLHKWKCPHQGCNGSFKTSNSFIGHLKSPAHSDEKFQCLKCYRYYNSATALAQHAESQGVRCNVRDTDDFESVVRGITAGTTTTNGRLADDTVRYEINPDAVLASKKMAESYRAVTKDRDEARRHYWDDKTPQW